MDIQNTEKSPQIGDVFLMRFNGAGNEQNGWRPGLVFQNNIGNAYSPNIIALPLTGTIKKISQPTHVLVSAADSGLKKDSMILCENPERMSKSKMGHYITTLSDEYMKKVATANLLATSAISFLDADALLDIQKRASELNSCIVS